MNILEQAEAAQTEYRRAERALKDFAEAINRTRGEGDDLSMYRLDRWYRSTITEDTDWSSGYEYRYEIGTPVLVLEFHSAHGFDDTVIVPLSYLDDLDTAVEREIAWRTERREWYRQRREEGKKAAEERALADRRAQYEKLKAEFGG